MARTVEANYGAALCTLLWFSVLSIAEVESEKNQWNTEWMEITSGR